MASSKQSVIITVDQLQLRLRELVLLYKREKQITEELRAYVREYGPVEGCGLYVDNRQCVYPETPKPDLLAEAIHDLLDPDDIIPMFRKMLEVMPIATYKKFIKSQGELGQWMQALTEMDEDAGMYTHYGEATIDVRKSPASEKHNVVMPGELPLGGK